MEAGLNLVFSGICLLIVLLMFGLAFLIVFRLRGAACRFARLEDDRTPADKAADKLKRRKELQRSVQDAEDELKSLNEEEQKETE